MSGIGEEIDIPLPSADIVPVESLEPELSIGTGRDIDSISETLSQSSSSTVSIAKPTTTGLLPSSPTPSPPAQSSPVESETDNETIPKKAGPPVGMIVGILLGALVLLALIFFAIRVFYIRRRKAHADTSMTRARIANISGPTNFTHLESGTMGERGNVNILPVSEVGMGGVRSESPVERMKQKYASDTARSMESGLGSHVQTMRGMRKPAPTLDS